jgi:hypothetical protein
MGIRPRVLLALVLGSLLLSILTAYFVVLSQGPKQPSQALYGPADFAAQ